MDVADLTLRFGATRVFGRVYWPAAGAERALMMLLAADDVLARGLCWATGAVVLTLLGRDQQQTLGWAVDHAEELGARPDWLLIAGGADAAWLVVTCHRAAWPVVRRQLLIHPVFSTARPMPPELTGLPPATVLSGQHDDGGAYSERMRVAGVEVEEVRGPVLVAVAGSMRRMS